MRVVAVHVPGFSVLAHRRRDPDLRRRPLALVEGDPSEVVACSPDAERRGVARGMSAAAAESVCAEGAVLPLDAAYCRAEHDRVSGALLELAPEVEEEALGSWCFRAEGLGRLHATEPRLVLAARQRVRAVGYAARVAVASGRFPALAATWYGRSETACVPDGSEAALLAPFPVEAAPLGEPALRRLKMLGVATLGELARLAEESVRARFGDEGAHAHRLARGLDPTPLLARGAPAIVAAATALEEPSESLDVVLFHLRALCDRVVGELEAKGLACWEARLELRVEAHDDVAVPARLSRPTLSGRALWTLLRLRLERIELEGAVAGIRLAVVDAPPARAEQRVLFRAVRDEEQLEAVIERLRARFGPDATVSPIAVEVHRPEARVAWRAYRLDDGAVERVRALGPGDVRVLRLVAPQPLTAEEQSGRVVCFTGTGLRCHVARASEAHRLAGEWWGEEYARDYYIVLTDDGRLLWVFRVHGEGSWWAHGEFD